MKFIEISYLNLIQKQSEEYLYHSFFLTEIKKKILKGKKMASKNLMSSHRSVQISSSLVPKDVSSTEKTVQEIQLKLEQLNVKQISFFFQTKSVSFFF